MQAVVLTFATSALTKATSSTFATQHGPTFQAVARGTGEARREGHDRAFRIGLGRIG